MDQEELSIMMKQSSEEAVNHALQDFEISLDGSVESIKEVDAILVQYAMSHQNSPLSDKHVFTICNLFGAYIGEIFIQNVGGSWFYDDSEASAPFIGVSFNDKTFAFPGICYQKLVNDTSISTQRYYELAVDGVTQ